MDKCTKLVEINLSGCPQFSEEELDDIEAVLDGRREKEVVALLTSDPQLHPDAVAPRLKGRGLGFLKAVATSRTDITTIDLQNMLGIKVDDVKALMDKCTKLVEINLSGCPQFSEEELDDIETVLDGRREKEV